MTMNANTMKLLCEYLTEQHRRDRERNSATYSTIYKQSVTDTNGVHQDWAEKDQTE